MYNIVLYILWHSWVFCWPTPVSGYLTESECSTLTWIWVTGIKTPESVPNWNIQASDGIQVHVDVVKDCERVESIRYQNSLHCHSLQNCVHVKIILACFKIQLHVYINNFWRLQIKKYLSSIWVKSHVSPGNFKHPRSFEVGKVISIVWSNDSVSFF